MEDSPTARLKQDDQEKAVYNARKARIERGAQETKTSIAALTDLLASGVFDSSETWPSLFGA